MITTPSTTPVATSWHDVVHRGLLLSACAERFAVELGAVRLPDPEKVDGIMRLPAASIAVPASTGLPFVVAEHLGARGGQLDEDDLAAELAAGWQADPCAAVDGAALVLAEVRGGRPWWETASALHGGQGSYGSGAAVRAIAVGLLPRTGIGAVAQLARRAAAVTHTHPLAQDGAAATAVAVALAAYGYPDRRLDASRFLDIVAGQVRGPELRSCLNIVRALVRHRAGLPRSSGPSATPTPRCGPCPPRSRPTCATRRNRMRLCRLRCSRPAATAPSP
ncbi:ADP-ribosylglycohydrolase family protein [Catellatospora coxensis]